MPLKKAGATWKGLCPFHGEKTPSFHVNPDKGFFYCFGCQAGGDVFKFVELQEKVGFQDAVRLLAQQVRDDGAGGERRRRDRQRRARDAAQDPRGRPRRGSASSWRRRPATRARQQLAARGIGRETIERLGLGYALPSREALKAALLRQGFGLPLLVKSGLVVERDDGRDGRSLPRPADDPDLPRQRFDRGLRRPGDGGRAAAEVPELAGNADLLEGPHAVRAAPDEGGHPARRLRGTGRGVFRLRAGAAGGRARSSPRAERR